MSEPKSRDGLDRPERVGVATRTSRFYRLCTLVVLCALISALTIFRSFDSALSTIVDFWSRDPHPPNLLEDPAREFKDDVWPLRQQTPWDISTDYPYPRKLQYDVAEGTWLRLDVHPRTGEIVFDMLGDIYCLSAEAYSQEQLTSGHHTKAVPILLGVPHDSDPHFSPDGDRIVFRSDAGLGVENIWVMNYTSCEEMNLRPSHPTGQLLNALESQGEEKLLAIGHRETAERKQRRLVREGRAGGA